MKASDWEFRNRALLIGLIFCVAFTLSALDHQNSALAFANWIAGQFHLNADRPARLLFALAAIVLVLAALLRTWASSYLRADVVYAANVKTESLVADGPYRHVRNPLYLANILMMAAMGAMMSRTGFIVALAAILVFSYRLIAREEAELQATQGGPYLRYRAAVPRLWFSVSPRVSAAGTKADWGTGFKAESWYWGFAAAITVFAITLKVSLFFTILAASLVLFWVSSSALEKSSRPNPASKNG